MFDCQPSESGARFRVHLTPRSSKDEAGGLHDGAIKIKIKAPPVDGKANKALIKFLSKTLKVSAGKIEIVTGQTSRTKMIQVSGVSCAEICQRLGV